MTNVALDSIKNHIRERIAYAQYKVGGTYYKADIRSTQILSDGRLAITFLIDHTLPGNITISEVQLYDHNGKLWDSKVENITRKANQEGVLYRFAYTITAS